MQAFCGFSAVFLAFIIPHFDRFCTVYRIIEIIQLALIMDEWLLYPLTETEARDLLEIAEARYKKASTIFCSQFDIPAWRDKIGEPILADAVCDRIVHDSYSIVIECKESMRKRKGIAE
jgi:DNA replication protein DnaC